MYRWLAVAAVGAALLALPALGQRRGGSAGGFGGHAGFASHGTVVGRGGMTLNRGFGLSGSFRSPHFGGGFTRPFFDHPHFGTRRRYFGYGGYYGYPYYGYPSYYDDGYYPADNYADDRTYAPDQQDQLRQQAEIDRLEDEVDRLRQERTLATNSRAPSRSDMDSLTELVFRDKHTQEVENYAIAGQTFWIFDGGQARKVPLSDLDVSATIKANDARGVDFQLPR
jgi:hypothetical protein